MIRQPSASPIKFGIIPAHGPDVLATALEHVRLAQRYGFDSIWIEEHHASGPYWPTPLLAIAALIPHLEGLTIGTDVLVLPLHDPVHVAEQAAILDRMTSGGFILGVGLGDNVSEFATFRVPARQRGARFEEQLTIIRALWAGENVDYQGRFYQLKGAHLASLPVTTGGPPIWIGGWGPRQLERAARFGDAWLPGPVGRIDEIVDRQRSYDETVARLKQDADRPRPLTRDVIVAESDTAAWRLAFEHVLPAYAQTYLDEHTLLREESHRQPAELSQDKLRELAQDRLLVGNPTSVASQVMACTERLAADHLIFRLKLPGLEPEQMTEMLTLLGQEVMPTLRQAS